MAGLVPGSRPWLHAVEAHYAGDDTVVALVTMYKKALLELAALKQELGEKQDGEKDASEKAGDIVGPY